MGGSLSIVAASIILLPLKCYKSVRIYLTVKGIESEFPYHSMLLFGDCISELNAHSNKGWAFIFLGCFTAWYPNLKSGIITGGRSGEENGVQFTKWNLTLAENSQETQRKSLSNYSL